MTRLTVVPTRLRLVLGEADEYPLTAVDIVYSGLGINVCMCSLAVGRGRREDDPAAPSLAFERGTPAKVYVYGESLSSDGNTDALPPNEFKAFEGYVDVGGPANISFGQFTAQVKLSGRLMKLDSGTLQTSSIVPTGYTDMSVHLDTQYVLQDKDKINAFGAVLKATLIRMATGELSPRNGVLRRMEEVFGAFASNTEASAILNTIVTHLDMQPALMPGHGGTLTNLYTEILTRSSRLSSFYQKIMTFGSLLRFRLLELPGGIYMVPYTPLFPASYARTITPDTYSSVSWSYEGISSYQGCVLLGKGAIASDPVVSGAYKRPGGTGRIMTEMAPPICMTGAGTQASVSPLVANIKADAKEPQINTSPLGDVMARHICLERIYGTRQMTMSVPYFRVDIGPLSSIRIVYPEITDQLGAEVYGSVQQVRISINATAKTASTTYDVGYVRSFSEQYTDIGLEPDPSGLSHPIWQYNLYGTRLDQGI